MAPRSDQNWPDEIKLLKRIRRNDGQNVQDESQFLAGNVGAENTSPGLAEQEPTPEYVLSLDTYGQIEENERRRVLYTEELDWERGQMRRLTILSNRLRELLQEVVDFYPAVEWMELSIKLPVRNFSKHVELINQSMMMFVYPLVVHDFCSAMICGTRRII